jgi:hypothetical protein
MSTIACPQCKKTIDSDSTFCEHCAADITKFKQRVEEPLSPAIKEKSGTDSSEVSSIKSRYRDGYIVARFTTGVGTTIKAIGLILAVIIAIGIFSIGASSPQFGMRRDPTPGAIVGVVLGGMVFTFFYVIGILVSAQGQILKASLDSAVNSSPFLTNEHRAKIMSL